MGTVTSIDAYRADTIADGYDNAADFLLDQQQIADTFGTLTADQSDILARAVVVLRARANHIRNEANR